jgi:hypothetical protein
MIRLLLGIQEIAFAIAFVLSGGVAAQDTARTMPADRDPQALAILQNALAHADSRNALPAVKDFRETGTITYYWAGQQVQGKATVRGLGLQRFRLDAQLPEGTRSWIVNRGTGWLKAADGRVTTIPYHNAVALGALTLPSLKLLTAVNSATSVTYAGVEKIENSQFQHIQINEQYIPGANPKDQAGRLGLSDIYIDPATNEIVGIQNNTHPIDTMNREIPHAIYFADFRSVDGIAVPFAVSEWINGQKIWSLQLDAVQFNRGLTDADFYF